MSIQKEKKQVDAQQMVAPLLSWDIFMEGYNTLKVLADDMQHLQSLSRKYAWQPTWNLEEKFLQQRKVIIVTDPSQQIVFASRNVGAMNGYTPAEVIGHTPKIFQGRDSDPLTRAIIREAIKELNPFDVSLLNYKKNGNPYHCNIEGYPIFNRQHKLMHFIAFETFQHDH